MARMTGRFVFHEADRTWEVRKRSTVLLSKIKQLQAQDDVLQTILATSTPSRFETLLQDRDSQIAKLKQKLDRKNTKIDELFVELNKADANYKDLEEAYDLSRKTYFWIFVVLVLIVFLGQIFIYPNNFKLVYRSRSTMTP